MNVLPSSEARRHVPQGNARPEFPDHGLDEEPIPEIAVAPNVSRTTWQQILDPRELIVAQCVAVHLGASERRLPMNHAFTVA